MNRSTSLSRFSTRSRGVKRGNRVGNEANLALYKRYRSARHDPVRMRALIDEAKVPA
jgi:hypothetical protein